MRVILISVLSLCSCLSAFTTRDPVDMTALVKKSCDQDTMDPPEYQDLDEDLSIRVPYWNASQSAHKACEAGILAGALENGNRVKENSDKATEAGKEGLEWGAGLTLLGEFLLAAALHSIGAF